MATDVAIISDESVNFWLWLLWSCGRNVDALSQCIDIKPANCMDGALLWKALKLHRGGSRTSNSSVDDE